MLRILRPLLFLMLVVLSQGCVGSDIPRKVDRRQVIDKPYIPPEDPNLLIPSEILARELESKKARRAVRRVVERPYVNFWKAHDDDVQRVTQPKPARTDSAKAAEGGT